ncbi:MerR family transcriptional regulator [Roseinatronobacter alkalisoli]|uniref:MerR family transcriptional regulator n=1 Tax=Roseinatronobacter alkalisoli TaxID=3028235 RepID=A0ABT5TBB6_9RHOB|nr:MerR family transcriptional regulator [Roseinatronobacter sp. HJB301]MDD7971477.1 MerR family transcriptional regulator [Roseinatronobacter sp. HJB301]
MRKAPEAFRTISETAEALETPAHVLRFWESRFSQVKPVKRAGGRRYYRRADIDLLAGIKELLHGQGMTIRGVQKLLQEKGARHVAALAPVMDKTLGEDERADAEPMPAAPAAAPAPVSPPVATPTPSTAPAPVSPSTATPRPPAPVSPPVAPPTPNAPQTPPSPQRTRVEPANLTAPVAPQRPPEPVQQPPATAAEPPSPESVAPLAAQKAPQPDDPHLPGAGTTAASAETKATTTATTAVRLAHDIRRRLPVAAPDAARITPLLTRLEGLLARMAAKAEQDQPPR